MRDRFIRSLVIESLKHPALYLPMLRAAWRFRARYWYRRPPFLPMPTRDYVAWRMHTAYGDDGAVPDFSELVRYLRWADRSQP